jgi:hypothetical protein
VRQDSSLASASAASNDPTIPLAVSEPGSLVLLVLASGAYLRGGLRRGHHAHLPLDSRSRL